MGDRHIRFKMTGRRQPNQSIDGSKFLEIIILVNSSFPLRRMAMPPPKGPIWNHFLPGAKQNGSHLRAHCHGCIEKKRPIGAAIELDDDGSPKLSGESWVIEGESCKPFAFGFANLHYSAMAARVGGVLGVKDSMVAHILGKGGNSRCPNASVAARKTARAVKGSKDPGKRLREEVSESEDDDGGKKKKPKRKMLTKVETSLKQSQLKVFRGIEIPFTDEQQGIVQEQFLRATISANLPFRWVEDPEVIKLFYFFRATAGDVVPSRLQMSGQLLDDANQRVTKRLKAALRGEYAVLASDGWKDESRDSVNGVNISVEGKVKYPRASGC